MIRRIAKLIFHNSVIARVLTEIHDSHTYLVQQEFREKYDIHQDARFNGSQIELYGGGEIRMGAGSYIGRNSGLQASEGYTIEIGDNCALSHYIRIYTSNRVADQDLSQSKELVKGDVSIGDYAWIGAFVFITEDTAIGENAVVGAHSVVTDDLPPHSICAGTPAKVQKFKSYLDDEERQKLANEYSSVLSEKLRNQFD